MPQSKKYLKFGLRSDKNLSDLTDTDVAITNIINDMSVQSQPGATIVESFDASSGSVVNVTTNRIVIADHPFSTGDEVVYSSTGAVDVTTTALSPLVSGTTYFVRKIDASNIELYDTSTNALNTALTTGLIVFTSLSGVTSGASNHKLFRVTLATTGFDADDLRPITGLSLSGLQDRVLEDEEPLGQSVDLVQLGGISETYIRSADNTSLLVGPRVTINDRLENNKSIVGDPPLVSGGDGPLAFIVPSNRINSAFPLPENVTGDKSSGTADILGTKIYTDIFQVNVPAIIGPVDFWDTGDWKLDGQLDNTFRDEFGLIQWIGYLSESYLQRIKTNGFYIVEQDVVSDSDNETESNWETVSSVVNESIDILVASYTADSLDTYVTVVPTNTSSINSLGIGMSVVIEGTSRKIVNISYDALDNPTSFVVEGGLNTAVNTQSTLTFTWEFGKTDIFSSNFKLNAVSSDKKLRVRYTVWWPKFAGRSIATKSFEVQDANTGFLRYTSLYSKSRTIEPSEHSFEFFQKNRVSSTQEESKKDVRINDSVTIDYIPPMTNGQVHSVAVSGNASELGPGRKIIPLNDRGRIKSTTGRFPEHSGSLTTSIINDEFIGSRLVIRTKTKLHEFPILERPGHSGTFEAIIDEDYISKINAAEGDDTNACPMDATNGTGAPISVADGNPFIGMLWEHIGLVGIYRLEYSDATTGILHPIENGAPTSRISSGDLLYQHELGWTNTDLINSNLSASGVTDLITSPLVTTSITLSAAGATQSATVKTRKIHQSTAAFVNTEASGFLGNGKDFATDVIVGVYASTAIRDNAEAPECRGIYGKLTTATANAGQNVITLENVDGLIAGNATVGDYVQFEGSVPASTHISAIDTSNKTITLQNSSNAASNIIASNAIPAGRTVIIIPREVVGSATDDVYNPASPTDKTHCVFPIDNSAPFLSTEDGLETASGSSDLKAVKIKTDTLSIRVPPSTAILDYAIPSTGDLASTAFSTSNNEITVTSHSFIDGDAVKYSKGNAANTQINGLVDGTVYFVNKLTANTLTLHDTRANAITGGSTGIKAISSGGTGNDHRLTAVTSDILKIAIPDGTVYNGYIIT